MAELQHRRFSVPCTLANTAAHLLGPVEPERLEFLRGAGPWLPYREIATVLGWFGPAQRAYSVVPILAKAVMECSAAAGGASGSSSGDGWRLQAANAGKPVVHYRWEGCLGALRRAAVLYEAVCPLLRVDVLGMRLNQGAGF